MADFLVILSEAAGAAGEAHADPTAFGLNATVWVSIAMLAFLGILVWKKVPAMIGASLDKKIAEISKQLGEAEQLRLDAESLKAEYEAKAAAATRKNNGERSQGELSFSLPGDPRLAAEGRLSLALRPGIPTDWRIKRVEHRLGAQGYTTQVECELFTAAPVPITATEQQHA